MRVWLAMLPAVGVLVAGCARQPVAPTRPGPGPKLSPASIVSADPSPTGTALVIGLCPTGPPVGFADGPRPPDQLWLIDLRTGGTRELLSDGIKRAAARQSIGSALAWRPDGTALALRMPEGRIEIYDAFTGASRTVSPDGLWCQVPGWSPDGGRLAFAVPDSEPHPGMPREVRPELALYVVSADGSAPPRPQVSGLALSTRWWWSADGRRLRYATGDGNAVAVGRTDRGRIVEPVPSDEVALAYRAAWSPDFTKLAYSRDGDGGRGSVTAVVDAALAPLVRWQDADIPARTLRWSLDGQQVIARNGSGRTYLLDLTTKAGTVVDDPVATDKEPAGWVLWNGKPQLLFIDEQWKRLVVMESPKGPAYTLVALGKDGSPSLVLPSTKGN